MLLRKGGKHTYSTGEPGAVQTRVVQGHSAGESPACMGGRNRFIEALSVVVKYQNSSVSTESDRGVSLMAPHCGINRSS